MSLEKIGRFEIVSEIRKYRSGSLYKARDSLKGEAVAIRTLQPPSGDSQSLAAVQQLFQHAKNTCALKCENIAAVYGGGEEQGLPYVVLEYVEGISIRDMLARNDNFSAWDLADISRQICRALDHAASRGLVHPNLHPGNIVETWDGSIKILGFDLVSDTDRITAAKFPESVHYWSPEKVKREPMDCRSNLFSWGAILYEMVTGRKAFEGESLDVITVKIVSDSPAEPTALKPAIDARLADSVMKALSKPPTERYQSGSELVSALEECSKNKVTPPVPVTFNVPVVPPAPLTANVVEAQQPQILGPNAPGGVVAGVEAAERPQAPPAPAATPAKIAAPAAASLIARSPATPIASRSVAKPKRPEPANMSATLQQWGQAVHSLLSDKAGMRFYAKLAGCVLAAVMVVMALSAYFGRTPAEQPLVSSSAAEAAELKDPPATASATSPETNPAPIMEESAPATEVEPPAVEAKPSRMARRKAKPQKAAAAPVVPAITSGELVVDSSPQGAAIEIDGQKNAHCVTPCSISGLTAGQHVVSLTKTGYTPGARPIEITPGAKSIVALQLAPATAAVMLSSSPAGASVYVDGKNTGRVTPAQLSLPKGHYTFLLQKPGHLEATTTAELQPGQVFQFAPTLVALGDVQDVKEARKFGGLLGRGSKDMGRVQIKIRPKGSLIEVNQRTMEKTTPAEFLFPPGSYKLKISQAGYKPLERVIVVTAGSSTVLNESLQQ